jgi:hypothetical protein
METRLALPSTLVTPVAGKSSQLPGLLYLVDSEIQASSRTVAYPATFVNSNPQNSGSRLDRDLMNRKIPTQISQI